MSLIYTNLAAAYQHLARYEESMAWASTIIALGEASDYLMAIAYGHEFIAENNLAMGHWQRSLESARIDCQIGEKVGSPARIAWGQWCEGYALYGLGRLHQAADVLAQALDIASTVGEKRLVVLTETVLALVHIDLGDDLVAQEYSTSAREKNQHMNEPYGRGFVLQINGYVHLQKGELDQAAEAYRQMYDALAGTEIRDVFLYCQPYIAELKLLLGEEQEALAILEESLKMAREGTAPIAEAITRRVLGQLLATQGDFAGAAAAFEQAIALMTETGSQLALGRAYYYRAIMHELQRHSDLALRDGTQAQTIFADCDAARDLDQANALLARLQ
jgi:tetratricopeptide (TPR) repeat protein